MGRGGGFHFGAFPRVNGGNVTQILPVFISRAVALLNAIALIRPPLFKASSKVTRCSSSFLQTWLGFVSQPPSQSLKRTLRVPAGEAAFRLGGSGLRSHIYNAGPRPGGHDWYTASGLK